MCKQFEHSCFYAILVTRKLIVIIAVIICLILHLLVEPAFVPFCSARDLLSST